jgi:O-Antigen ligase
MAFLDLLRNSPLGAKLARFDFDQAWAARPSGLFCLCGSTLVASLMLGGATRSGFLSDTILELIAIPTLIVSLSSLLRSSLNERKRGAEWGLVLCLGVAIIPLVQLIPLPPSIWTKLPHRQQITGVFELLNGVLPWLPISVSPSLTWASLLSLLPPIAIFLGIIQLDYRERRLISLIFVALGIFEAFLGLLQVAQGPSSPWRFYAVTNDTESVGFFANRNHLAALLNCALVFGAAWGINTALSFDFRRERKNVGTASVVTVTASFLGILVLMAAEATTRSRAGVGLLIVALFAALALALSDRRRPSGATPIKWIVGSVVVASVLVVQFTLYRILDRFQDPLQGARLEFAHNTIAAAEAYMPFGSGFGTFVSVYPSFEPPQDVVDNRYVNRAHDDLLEIVLEGGAMSVMLVAGFLAWLFFMSRKIWRNAPTDERDIDLLLARAATIVIPLIIAHSAVDYPLRTEAMMAVFALACAFLIEPLSLKPSESRARNNLPAEFTEEERLRLAIDEALSVSHHGARDRSAPQISYGTEQIEDELPGQPQVGMDADDFSSVVEAPLLGIGSPEDMENLPPGGPDDAEMWRRAAALNAPTDLDDGTQSQAVQAVVAEADSGAVQAIVAPEELSEKPPDVPSERPPRSRNVPVSGSAKRAEPPHSMPDAIVDPNAASKPKNIGNMAYMLAKYNRLSSVLVEQSEAGVKHGDEPSARGNTLGAGGAQPANLAQGKMKLLRSLKISSPSGMPVPQEKKDTEIAVEPVQELEATESTEVGNEPDVVEDPFAHRMKVLHSVSFTPHSSAPLPHEKEIEAAQENLIEALGRSAAEAKIDSDNSPKPSPVRPTRSANSTPTKVMPAVEKFAQLSAGPDPLEPPVRPISETGQTSEKAEPISAPTESSFARLDAPAEPTPPSVAANREKEFSGSAGSAATDGTPMPRRVDINRAPESEETPRFTVPETKPVTVKPKKIDAFVFADSNSLTESRGPAPHSSGTEPKVFRRAAPTSAPVVVVKAPVEPAQSDFDPTPSGETFAPEEIIESYPQGTEAAGRPEKQWGNEIEWPGQWQAEPAENTAARRGKAQVSAPEMQTGREITGTPAEAIPQPFAPSAEEIQPQSNELTVQGQAPLPVIKPKAPAARSTGAESPGLPQKARWGDEIEWPDTWKK